MAEAIEDASLNRLTRDRVVLATGLALVCALAWAFTILGAQGMEPSVSKPWSAGQLAMVFVMWVVMMGAIVMGLRHGGYCIGCCAGLMALLFAVAVMSIPWVAALTVLVMIEKLLPGEAFWRHAIGAVLTLTGIVLIGRAILG